VFARYIRSSGETAARKPVKTAFRSGASVDFRTEIVRVPAVINENSGRLFRAIELFRGRGVQSDG